MDERLHQPADTCRSRLGSASRYRQATQDDQSTQGSRITAVPVLVAIILLASAAGGSRALAQSASFGVAVRDLASGPMASVELADFATASGTGTLRVGLGTQAELGLRLREAGSLAGVGNLVTTLGFDASTVGSYQLAIAGRGVLGPVAARARLGVSDGSGTMPSIAEGALGELPAPGPGTPLWSFELGGSYRLSRQLLVDLAPAVLHRDGSWGGRLDLDVRWLRAVGNDDLSLLLHTFLAPDDHSLSLAAGVGYAFNRPRAPQWKGSAWLGVVGGRLHPGARLEGSDRLGSGTLTMSLGVESYRLDAWPLRGELAYRLPLTDGVAQFDVRAGRDLAGEWRAAGRVSYRIELPR